jgi:predicted metal-dependent hydrolase
MHTRITIKKPVLNKLNIAAEEVVLSNFGDALKVAVRRSTRARRILIKFDRKDVSLIIPERTSQRKAIDFLFSKEEEVRSKMASIKNEQTIEVDNSKILLFGELHELEYVLSQRSVGVQIKDMKIIVHTMKNNGEMVLTYHLQNLVKERIKTLLESLSQKLPLTYKKISVKELASKWGSCSSNGNLSFNWRLVFAPDNVLEYLVVHEYCHLKELNHSKKFWKLVAQLYPGYKQAERWLKIHGRLLYEYLKV